MTTSIPDSIMLAIERMAKGELLTTNLVTGEAWLRLKSKGTRPVERRTMRALVKRGLVAKASERRLLRRWQLTDLGRAAMRNRGEIHEPGR